MTIPRLMRIIPGAFIIISVVLFNIYNGDGTIFSQWNWLLFTLFVGINLLQSGFTQWCLLETILKKLGVKP